MSLDVKHNLIKNFSFYLTYQDSKRGFCPTTA
jgi:hypothetical protein